MDINRMHRVFNHASEDVLRATAKERGWKITGTFETCRECKEANAQQKGVSKTTATKSDIPGERLFIDITSVKHKSLGGKQFWLVIVDDATSFTWSYFLVKKSDTTQAMLSFLNMIYSVGVTVKYIRCDNAGENLSLHKELKNHDKFKDIKFEFTPRDSPQYNGKAERKIGILTGRVRSLLTAAGLTEALRQRLWAEAAMFATDMENLLHSIKSKKSPYDAFKIDMPKPHGFRQFGEVGIVKFTDRIKSKLKNRGTPVLYLHRADLHAPDVCRVLKLDTKKVLITRDIIWLNQTFGEFKGDKRLKDIMTIADVGEYLAIQDVGTMVIDLIVPTPFTRRGMHLSLL
jgi:hypothetical protein